MERQRKHQAILFCTAAVVMLLCVSCQHKAVADTHVDKYFIDISDANAVGPYSLNKHDDERIIWINNSGNDLYICADPKNDPFEAYGWFVPKHDQRKSGKISDTVNPPQSYDNKQFYTYPTPCLATPPPADANRSNPKIIIQ
jgi:hypothetical protein